MASLFTAEQREVLAASSDLAAYADITEAHLLGLCDACSNYLIRRPALRSDELPLPTVAPTPGLVSAHKALVECCQRLLRSPATGSHALDGPVFSERQRAEMRLDKYHREWEHLTPSQAVELLQAVSAYARVATAIALIEPNSGPFVSLNRYLHAHNWILRFATAPFTDKDFVDDLHRAVLDHAT